MLSPVGMMYNSLITDSVQGILDPVGFSLQWNIY
jgi:hypothetical protein